MTTSVTITGSGTPIIAPGRAGAGALVRHDDTLVQVDIGRATALRLTELGVALNDLDAILVTHHHSDHLLGLPDLLVTRWTHNGVRAYDTLPVHCPVGPAVDYVNHVFDHLGPDLANRRAVSGYPDDPHPVVHAFEPAATGTVHVADFGALRVDAALVDHGDLEPAVAYRFTSPDGVIVISGDTCACAAVEELAAGADVLVHEVFSSSLLESRGIASERVAQIGHHHTEAEELGVMAARLETPTLVLTHLVPSPATDEDRAFFEASVRSGGFAGQLIVADDLDSVTIG